MKLLTFTYRGREKIGALIDHDRVVDLQRAAAWYLAEAKRDRSAEPAARIIIGHDKVAFLKKGDRSLELARRTVDHARTGSPREATTIFWRNQPFC